LTSDSAKPFDRPREAGRMLDLFASVGALKFDITFTDIDERLRGFRPVQSLDTARRAMCSSLIQCCAARGTIIIVRPHSPPGALLLQLDDLDIAVLARVAPAAFLILATSPGNHQAWVAVKGGSNADFGGRVKKAAGADPSASGATRIAGSGNFKRKYEPNFPTVAILRSAPGAAVTASDLDAMGLVAPRRVSQVRPILRVDTRAWPNYERCLAGAPLGRTSGRPDSLRADFTWCVIAADWGHGTEAIAAELLRVSVKAKQNGDKYANLTAERAAAAVRTRSRSEQAGAQCCSSLRMKTK
jgi:hypothetical protein